MVVAAAGIGLQAGTVDLPAGAEIGGDARDVVVVGEGLAEALALLEDVAAGVR